MILALLATANYADMNGVSFFGDFRFRADSDKASKRFDGETREKTERKLLRFRAGVKYRLNRKLSFAGRIKAGGDSRQNQQSSFASFGDEFAAKNVYLDQAYAKGRIGRLKYWVGKNAFPFWKQNQLYWDSDVNPEGITFYQSFKGMNDAWKIRPVFGYYSVRADNTYADSSTMMAYQLNGKFRMGHMSKIKWGTGMIHLSNISGWPDSIPSLTSAVNKDTLRDYRIWVSSVKWGAKFGRIPFGIGFDYIKNLEDKTVEDEQFKDPLEDEKTGMAINVHIGKLKDRGDWKLRYTYADIGKHAVAPYFAQDHWHAWRYSEVNRDSHGTRSSNFKGHGIALSYGLSKGSDLTLSTYKVESKEVDKLLNRANPDSTVAEDSDRMRLDYTLSFK